MMRKLFTLALALILAAGCIGALAEGKPYEGVTIQVSLNTPSDAVREAYDAWLDYLKAQILEETGINMVVEMESWGDYLNKHLMAVASGEGSDIIQMGSGVPPVIAATGGLLDLTEHMDMFGGYDAYCDAGHHYMTYDGKVIAVPWGGGGREMYYNKNLYDAAGLEYPVEGWTYEDFLEDVDALTKYMGQPAYAVCGSGGDTGNYFWSTVVTNGGGLVDESGKVQFNNEIGVAAVRQVLDLYDNGYLRSSFVDGRCAGCVHQSGSCAGLWQRELVDGHRGEPDRHELRFSHASGGQRGADGWRGYAERIRHYVLHEESRGGADGAFVSGEPGIDHSLEQHPGLDSVSPGSDAGRGVCDQARV